MSHLSEQIVCVTGAMRCGTSLCMQMLHHGGITAYADSTISCESGDVLKLPWDTSWLPNARGKCLKILDPIQIDPFPEADWRFILMYRNPRQQALSWVKFMREVARLPIHESKVSLIGSQLRTEYPQMRRLLVSHGTVLELKFEDVLRAPLAAAHEIMDYLDCQSFDVERAAAQVVKRDPECYPGFLELELMHSERGYFLS
jgi:hypothetical protein